MLTFLKRKTGSIPGIDISSTAITILELSKTRGQYRVEAYDRVLIDDASLMNDAGAIADRIRHTHLIYKQAITSVPDSSTITKIIHVSADLQEHEIEEWAFMEAEKYIPYPLDNINLDFNIVGASSDHFKMLDVLIVASRSDVVSLRVDALRRASLTAVIVDVESFAIERAFQLLPCHMKNCALFFLNETFMPCLVFHKKKIIFSREDTFPGSQPDLILLQIKRALQFFSSTIHHVYIDHIILAGSVAHLPGLSTFLQEQLSVSTHIVNPFCHMTFATPTIREKIEKDASMLMVACGLALRGITV